MIGNGRVQTDLRITRARALLARLRWGGFVGGSGPDGEAAGPVFGRCD
jgi:hypothetical protein